MKSKRMIAGVLLGVGLFAGGCRLNPYLHTLRQPDASLPGNSPMPQATLTPSQLDQSASQSDRILTELQYTLQASGAQTAPVDPAPVDQALGELQATLQAPENSAPTVEAFPPGQDLDSFLQTLQAEATP